ncbi:MAG: c-type cytochrome [Anaerolineales bacterium]|jgi:mono/diheme cytochrome c family protein
MKSDHTFKLDYIAFIAIVTSMFSLAACGPGAARPEDIGDPQNGERVFTTGTESVSSACAGCHSLDGSQKEGENAGPSMQGIAETAATRTDQTAEEYLRESITNPGAFIVEGYRNNMEQGYQYLLTEEEINDLVAFMLTQ